jgi:hypothetical protein
MGYRFRGVFTRQDPTSLGLADGEYTIRDLRPRYPFWGVRLRDENVAFEQAIIQLIGAGLSSGLALSYSTWAGPLEHLAGFQVDAARIVEASRFDVDDSSEVDLSSLFVSKLTEYGLPLGEDGSFFAFARGFWGE